jgi:hypothetical protein
MGDYSSAILALIAVTAVLTTGVVYVLAQPTDVPVAKAGGLIRCCHSFSQSYLPLLFVFLLVQAFRMMTLGFNMNGAASLSRRQDRTGLLTTHPELLDQNGDITSEDLLVVKFPELGESEAAPA